MEKKLTNQYFSFSLFMFFVIFLALQIENGTIMAQNTSTKVGVKVGVVLDHMDTWLGKIGSSCISMALTDFYDSHPNYKTRLLLNARDVPNLDIVGAASAEERVLSNLARFVLIIWVFVVLILTQSYTASLTSMLTVQQLQPTITDMKELVKNGENVGYLQGSFVRNLLKSMGFLEANLKIYNSPEECNALFTNGSIVAVFDEIPYMKLFLTKYCLKYAMIEPIYKTDGFGFVFPRGSPLVPDVSRAVLNVIEGEKMVEIEKKWLGQHTSCPDTSTSLSSNSLGLESFWGLFLIAGIASISALLIYMVMFLYEHWHVLSHLDPQTSLWEKIVVLAKHIDNKDLSSHTFRKTGVNGADGADRAGLVDASPRGTYSSRPSTFSLHASPNNNDPPSPSTFSNNTEGNFAVSVEQGTPSRDYSDQDTQAQTAPEIVPEIELAIPTEDRSRTLESANGNC